MVRNDYTVSVRWVVKTLQCSLPRWTSRRSGSRLHVDPSLIGLRIVDLNFFGQPGSQPCVDLIIFAIFIFIMGKGCIILTTSNHN